MIELVKKHIDELENICRKYNVRRMELFGSAVVGDFNEQSSDLDFLVEFLPLKPGRYADTYFDLLFELEDLFDRRIDLVMPNAIKNQYFLEAVNKNRELLYAA